MKKTLVIFLLLWIGNQAKSQTVDELFKLKNTLGIAHFNPELFQGCWFAYVEDKYAEVPQIDWQYIRENSNTELVFISRDKSTGQVICSLRGYLQILQSGRYYTLLMKSDQNENQIPVGFYRNYTSEIYRARCFDQEVSSMDSNQVFGMENKSLDRQNSGDYQKPEYPGGETEMYKAIYREINYTPEEAADAVEDLIYLKVTVDTTGKITRVAPVKFTDRNLMRKAVDAVKKLRDLIRECQVGIKYRLNFSSVSIRFGLSRQVIRPLLREWIY